MVKGEGLQVLQERMKTMDPDQKEIYKFLRVEQVDGIKTKEVYNRVKEEINRRLQMFPKTELNDNNLIKAINTKVIPVAAYPVNVCKFTKAELNELDLVVKRELRKCNMLGRQSSDKRLYLKRNVVGRGLKSLRDVFVETRLRVACYMVKSSNKWIKAAWKRELLKETNSRKDDAIASMHAVGTVLDFEEDCILLDGERIEKDWKLTWRGIKARLKKSVEQKWREEYLDKQMQSKIFRKQDESRNLWLRQDLTPRKTASVMTMLEQMVETKSWKASRGLAKCSKCRLCGQQRETVEHLLAGCKVLANSEYLTRHNRALMILAISWEKEFNLVEKDMKWYKQKWCRGYTLENHHAKLVWDFEFNLRKTTTSRRPVLTLEDKEKNMLWILDMACPQENNIVTKRDEKQTKYRQLAFELREKAEYKIYVIPVIIGALGGCIKEAIHEVKKMFKQDDLREKLVGEMQRTILMDGETIIWKILSGLVQTNVL